MEKEIKKEKMTSENEEQQKRAKYRSFIDGLELRGIRQLNASFKSYGSIDLLKNAPSIDIEPVQPEAVYRTEDNNIYINQKYLLKAKIRGKNFIKIEAEFELHYHCKIGIDDEIFSVFKKSSLILNTWPYMRQYVHYATSQMGLPSLILPLLKVIGNMVKIESQSM